MVGEFSEAERAQEAGMVWSSREDTLGLVTGIFNEWEPVRQVHMHCYQFLKRPCSFEKETQKRPGVLYPKKDRKSCNGRHLLC